MAFKFNAILKFNSSEAQSRLNATGKDFKKFRESVSSASRNLSAMGRGVQAAGVALLPLSVGMGAALRVGADFELQMSKIQSLMLATKDDMIPLESTIRQLGRSTIFSATEVAKGAELLAQSGFDMKQITAALPGVLDAAATSGATMAEVADVMASNLGAFSLEASKAGEVADGLALATVLTNTNFQSLAEGLAYAAPFAKAAGMSFSETASAVGVLANAGIKGSSAGTALKNALMQLADPSKEAIKLFGGRNSLNTAIMEVGKNGKMQLRPMEVIMANMSVAISKAKNPMEAVRHAAELFGLRGASAFNAFEGQMLKTTDVTSQNIERLNRGIANTGDTMELKLGDKIPTLVALRLQMAGAAGTAKEMAKIRMDNFFGAWERFKGAVEDVAIGFSKLLLPEITKLTLKGADFIEALGLGFEVALRGTRATKEEMGHVRAEFQPLVDQATDFAKGFIEGFKEFKTEAGVAFDFVMKALKPFLGETSNSSQAMGRLVAKVVLWGSVLAPVLVVVSTGMMLLGPIIGGIIGTFGLLWSVSKMAFFGIRGGIGIANYMLALFGSKLTIASMAMTGLKYIGGLALKALMAPLGALIATVAMLGAGLYGIYQGWETIKFAFQEDGFFAAVLVAVGAFGQGFWDMISWPVIKLKDMMVDLFVWAAKKLAGMGLGIVSSIGGRVYDYIAGNTPKPIDSPSGVNPSSPKLAQDSMEAQVASNQLAQETIKQKTIVQPSSPEANAQALSAALPRGGAGGGGQSGSVNVKLDLTVEGKIKGSDINLAATRAQVSQSERNGRMVDPALKRRLLQNGSMAPAGSN